MKNHEYSKYGGVTLIELLTVLAVVAIFQTLAVPAMSSLLDSIRMSTGINTLLTSIHFARNEATKRNDRVVICKSAGTGECVRSGGWEQGWIVFHDRNNNAIIDAGESILLSELALPTHFKLAGNSPLVNYVSYTANGTTQLISGAFQAGTFTLCRQSDTSVQARQVVISPGGRPRTIKVMVENCL
ncbi:MAG: GspH/FimT family pseudopilin [Polaromonas sp.]|nr:GspH/FimT family pseudopilin [Polaromonas sp.]